MSITTEQLNHLKSNYESLLGSANALLSSIEDAGIDEGELSDKATEFESLLGGFSNHIEELGVES